LYEYVGNIHLHSTYSDGALTIPKIAKIGARNGLDFLVITDHQTLAGLDQGQEGYYDKTLVLIGMEANEHSHHYLALNVHKVVPDNENQPQKVIDEVNQQNGIGIIAHPVERGSKFYHNGLVFEWTDWSVQGFQGIEIWNYLSRWRDELTSIFSGLLLIMRPAISLHEGPYSQTLDILDRYQFNGQRVFAYGGSDAHGIRIRLPLINVDIGSYEEGFRSINTHILSEQPLQGSLAHDKKLIYTALAEGNSWVGCDYYKDSRGFRFLAQSPQGKWGMGSVVPYHDNITLRVQTPHHARVALMRNGKPWSFSQGHHHRFPVNRLGVYRIEAQHRRILKWQPWIFSNPIWIL
jgi:hypothetical protein